MIEPEASQHGKLGHNQPPSPIETARSEQREAQSVYEERRDEIAGAMDRKQVVDRISAGEAADLIKIERAFTDKLEAERVERSRPYREAADAVKAAHDEFIEPLHRAGSQLLQRLNQWRRDERGRADALQKEQQNVLGDAAKPPVDTSPVQNSPIAPAKKIAARGDYGAKAVDTTVTTYKVVDVRAVPDHILNSPTVHDAIIQVVKSMAKHFPDVPGVEKTTTEETRVR